MENVNRMEDMNIRMTLRTEEEEEEEMELDSLSRLYRMQE